MKYQVGDSVVLIHSGEKAVITDFINKQMVMVDVEGVSFPVYIDQIDFPYYNNFTQTKNAKAQPAKPSVSDVKREKNVNRYGLDEGIWIVWMPVFDKDVFDDDVVEYFKLYLVNQTVDDVTVHYQLLFDQVKDMELKHDLLSRADIYLHDFAFEKLNDSPKFVFEFSLKASAIHKAKHFEYTFKPKPKQVFKQVEEMRMKQQAIFHYPLLTTWPDAPIEPDVDFGKLGNAGYKIHTAQSRTGRVGIPRTVVDLHIEKLTDSWQSLSAAEMLDMQLHEFEKFYDDAVGHHQATLIVVHGLGSGRLRDEIHDLLRHKKEVKSFVNQYHPSFGYGATEIYFQY